jgi:thioredoxin-related protein
MKTLLTALAVTLLTCTLQASDFPKGSPSFFTTPESVRAAAKENGKPIIMVFSASWCGPCQAMKKDVYPSAAVKPFHDKFNWAYLDIDVEANDKLSNTYQVDAIPNIVFLNAAGTKIEQQEGGTSPESFAKLLGGLLKKVGSPKTASLR